MFKTAKPLFLICETPVHAGSGDDLGIVDLPIQRERHTKHPKFESSSLKGAIREASENVAFGKVKYEPIKSHKDLHKHIYQAFGFDDKTVNDGGAKEYFKEEDRQFAGCLGFSDARLLLFPVKSMRGVFVWITCPAVLAKFAQDLSIAKDKSFTHLASLKNLEIDPQKCLVVSDKVTIGKDKNKSIVLEEYAFGVEESKPENKIKEFAEELGKHLFTEKYWQDLLKTNLVVLTNDDFADFVQLSTEVITRTKINNETGTVQDGALFTEEYLPSDSVLYSLVLASPEFSKKDTTKLKLLETEKETMTFFEQTLAGMDNIFQLGGNATLGKGIIRTKLLNNKEGHDAK
jgi:CRISPR-associated protein Cmr4